MCGSYRLAAGLIAFVLALYVAIYAALYERGTREARELGFPFFFYSPISDIQHGENSPDQHSHCLKLFDPLNRLHQSWFDGMPACHGVTWGLSW